MKQITWITKTVEVLNPHQLEARLFRIESAFADFCIHIRRESKSKSVLVTYSDDLVSDNLNEEQLESAKAHWSNIIGGDEIQNVKPSDTVEHVLCIALKRYSMHLTEQLAA